MLTLLGQNMEDQFLNIDKVKSESNVEEPLPHRGKGKPCTVSVINQS